MIRTASKPSKLEQAIAKFGGISKPVADVRDLDVPVGDIKLDQSAQPRESLNTDRTAEYAEAMKADVQFPPLVVFHDGKTYWLADGFHRHYAAQHAGRKHIRCLVHNGGLREAILYSVGANADHGLARSDADKERAVKRLLDDPEWSQWSDREIARRCRVSDKTVAKYRPVSADDPQIERKVERGGTVYSQKLKTRATAAPEVVEPANVRKNLTDETGDAEPEEITGQTFEAQGVGGGGEPDSTGQGITPSGRRANDFYPTSQNLIAEIVARWKPRSKVIWEPCEGDGRVAEALRSAGYEVVTGDIAKGQDFFACESPPRPGVALCTNPPFGRAREFIDRAFAIGVREMCLVLPERFWASGVGRAQFERHRPAMWVNLDWRDDYLGAGGSPDRALAVAIWTSECAPVCTFEVWSRQAEESTEQPTTAAEVSTPDANTHGQTGTADRQARSLVPASRKAVAKQVGQSGQEAGVELPVDADTRPAIPAAADGQRSIPRDDARGAGRGSVVPHNHPQSTQAVEPFTNQHCQKPDTCKWAKSQASCSACANEAVKSRAAA